MPTSCSIEKNSQKPTKYNILKVIVCSKFN